MRQNLWFDKVGMEAAIALDKLGRGSMRDVARRCPNPKDPYLQRTAITAGDGGFGSGMVPSKVAVLVLGLAQAQAAYRTLNVRPAESGKTTFPAVTENPAAVGEAPFLTPLNHGTKLNSVATVLGGGFETEARDLPILVDVSLSLLDDAKTDFAASLAEAMAGAAGQRIDHAAFAADGTDDVEDGGMVGVFAHGDVAAVTASSASTVDTLLEEDLLRTIDSVADLALQRGCRWWIHPTLFKKMLRLRDGAGARLVQFEAGEAYLMGHPITLVAAGPSANTAGAKVLAFGCGDGYLVAFRDTIHLAVSDGVKFDFSVLQFRATCRVYCAMMRPSWFATLALAAA